MKNDIDSILESMFRGGRLHFKSSLPQDSQKEKKDPRPASKPAEGAGPLSQACLLYTSRCV